MKKKRSLLTRLSESISGFFSHFINGDGITKASYVVMGLGCLLRKQLVRGFCYLLIQVLFIWYMLSTGINNIIGLKTLGVNAQGQVWDEVNQIYRYTKGDNSMLMLLFGVLAVFVVIGFLFIYAASVKNAYENEQLLKVNKTPSDFNADVKRMFNEKFHVTILTPPILMVFLFTLLPLVFMILIAFTNFDKNHQPPGNLFTWVGLENFSAALYNDPVKSHTFLSLFIWTLVWAVFATFLNYIFGMILAIMINKKGIRLKKFWRTIFVTTIAVPQFVSLMLMSKLLHDQGAINVLFKNLGWIEDFIPFLSDPFLAKVTVIVVNLWVGMPYTMLITSGILMNIPADLYESARIDGAGPVTQFLKITMPYMLFVTTPYLITQFIGNINNFNVIYLLSGGGPLSLNYFQAGNTDLLVTWLYKLTVNEQNYSMASTIGIIIFIICSFFTLVVFNKTSSAQKEEEFQ
ncbi:MAG: sugar ABC transporter permease [Erysipelotrichaceae bacterium]|nr:sugar ABC transporter permease [Erysipelotrichaceae bacterium]